MTEERDPLIQLREQFREAAAREIRAETGGSGWFRRLRSARTLAVVLGLGVTGAGVATAVELISVGKDRPDVAERPDRFSSRAGAPRISVTAEDPSQELPWAVAIYTSPAGEKCAIVGHALGPDLGLIEDGEFRPYETGTGGACGNVEDLRLFSESRSIDGRTLLYGRARSDIVSLEVRFDGQRRRALAGPGGAFLLVFDEQPRDAELIPLAEDGREAPLRRPPP